MLRLVVSTAALATGFYLLSNIAHADSASIRAPVLTADEARSELYGVNMNGVSGNTNSEWSECITPDGDTVYQLDGYEMYGRMSILSDGRACFAYEHQDYQQPVCFKVSRTNVGYTFWGGPEGVFKARSVERNVEQCPSQRDAQS